MCQARINFAFACVCVPYSQYARIFHECLQLQPIDTLVLYIQRVLHVLKEWWPWLLHAMGKGSRRGMHMRRDCNPRPIQSKAYPIGACICAGIAILGLSNWVDLSTSSYIKVWTCRLLLAGTLVNGSRLTSVLYNSSSARRVHARAHLSGQCLRTPAEQPVQSPREHFRLEGLLLLCIL